MNWDDLKIVAAVRDELTYSGAGKRLGLDETTVARRLSRIQKELGFRLFNAENGRRKPTLQCSAILVHADEMTRQANSILAISDRTQPMTGHIRVTCTPSLAEEMLTPSLSSLLQDNPGLSLDLLTSSESVNFSKWEADLAIRLVKPEKGAFLVRKLGEMPVSLVWPKSVSKGSNDIFFCAYPEELNGTPEMQAIIEDNYFQKTRLRSANMRILRSTLLQGGCGGIMPDYMLGELKGHPDFDVTPLGASREIWLLIQSHLKDDLVARTVIDWLKTALLPISSTQT